MPRVQRQRRCCHLVLTIRRAEHRISIPRNSETLLNSDRTLTKLSASLCSRSTKRDFNLSILLSSHVIPSGVFMNASLKYAIKASHIYFFIHTTHFFNFKFIWKLFHKKTVILANAEPIFLRVTRRNVPRWKTIKPRGDFYDPYVLQKSSFTLC